jgi:hypothetical protein
VVGAVVLPVVQMAEIDLYNRLFDTILTNPMIGLDFARPFYLRLPIIGAWLGALSASVVVGWLHHDRHRVRFAAFCSFATFLLFVIAVVLNTRGNMRFGWGLRTYSPTLFCNAPLQWAMALAIVGRVGVKRLEREAQIKKPGD